MESKQQGEVSAKIQTLKVITLNIWGGKLLDDIMRYVQEQKPDICLFQEVYSTEESGFEARYHSLQTLQKSLPEYSSYYAPAFSAGYLDGKVQAGNLILSKLSIVKQQVTFFDVPYTENWQGSNPPGDFRMVPRNMQHAVVKHPEIGSIDVINVHGIWDFRGRDNGRRLAMAQTIVQATTNKEHVIIAGDFNMDSDTQAIQLIAQQCPLVFPDLLSSFNMRRKKDEVFARLAVDKMFTKSFQIVSAECPDVDLSDHRPLIATLQA